MTNQLIQGAHAARSTVGGNPFLPIADYGFLSDCEVSALVAPSGSVEWMCLPRMDGPSVFAAILDRGAGWFRLGPADLMVPPHLGSAVDGIRRQMSLQAARQIRQAFQGQRPDNAVNIPVP